MLETPVVFLIFNRPDLTERVFAAIAAQRPRRLLVVADGPRDEAEAALCAQTRAIIGRVDWPCAVETNWSETNLGCKMRVSSGLTWAFERVEEAIILEDDCLPHPSFFRFCSELLERYRDDERVMMVSGDNFQPAHHQGEGFYFSRYTHIWGWATWRRAWAHYDVHMAAWPDFRENHILPFGARQNRYWRDAFDRTWRGEVDTWDYQWQFAVWRSEGLVVLPGCNLVSNMGFDARPTHTKFASPWADLTVGEWQDESPSPPLASDDRADARTWERMFAPAASQGALWKRLARRLRLG